METKEIKIDLACGDNKREGFIGVDIFNGPSVDIVHDLNIYPYPFEDESVDEINCSHYLEHIKHDDVLTQVKACISSCNSFEEFKQSVLQLKPEQDGLIKFFNEIYRILKPGGKVKLVAPYYTSIRTYGDPTHTRMIADSTFWYVSKKWRDDNKLNHYGIICDFDVKLSYFITSELTLKSEEVRNKAFTHDWNTIDDIIIDMVKK